MAVTAIWDIKSRVDRVIHYAANLEKTTEKDREMMAAFHAVEEVIEYAADQMKTEQSVYVIGINCDPEIVSVQFQSTKKHWRKTGGIVAVHAYQSFSPSEIDAKTAHEIAIKLAQELWGNRFEVVVATHLNTNHCHNHFVFNSVSFMNVLTAQRQNLRKELRRFVREGDRSTVDELREQIKQLSERIKGLRKKVALKVALCDGISQRSSRVKEALEQALSQQNTDRGKRTRDKRLGQNTRVGHAFEPENR